MKRFIMHIVNVLLFVGIICAIGILSAFFGSKIIASHDQSPQSMEVSTIQEP